MDLSIVIVNWNTKELLANCLESVVGDQSSVGSGRWPVNGLEVNLRSGGRVLTTEILVVDNASTDGSPAMVRRRFPQVQLIENLENVGFARANNQAIRRSRGRYVLLLNSDTELHPGALEQMLEYMEDHPWVGACGPQLRNADGTHQISCQPMLTPWREFWRLTFLERIKRRASYDFSQRDFRSPRQVEVLKGACLLVRRAALDQVGLLDEQYFMYTEEVDLCYRLRQAGWQLFWLPQARVTHYGEGSTRQVAEAMYLQLYRSKIQFYRKVGGARQARLFKLLVTLAYLPRWLAMALSTPFAPALANRTRTYRRLLAELPGM